jgi:hypothetical protein
MNWYTETRVENLDKHSRDGSFDGYTDYENTK